MLVCTKCHVTYADARREGAPCLCGSPATHIVDMDDFHSTDRLPGESDKDYEFRTRNHGDPLERIDGETDEDFEQRKRDADESSHAHDESTTHGTRTKATARSRGRRAA